LYFVNVIASFLNFIDEAIMDIMQKFVTNCDTGKNLFVLSSVKLFLLERRHDYKSPLVSYYPCKQSPAKKVDPSIIIQNDFAQTQSQQISKSSIIEVLTFLQSQQKVLPADSNKPSNT